MQHGCSGRQLERGVAEGAWSLQQTRCSGKSVRIRDRAVVIINRMPIWEIQRAATNLGMESGPVESARGSDAVQSAAPNAPRRAITAHIASAPRAVTISQKPSAEGPRRMPQAIQNSVAKRSNGQPSFVRYRQRRDQRIAESLF